MVYLNDCGGGGDDNMRFIMNEWNMMHIASCRNGVKIRLRTSFSRIKAMRIQRKSNYPAHSDLYIVCTFCQKTQGKRNKIRFGSTYNINQATTDEIKSNYCQFFREIESDRERERALEKSDAFSINRCAHLCFLSKLMVINYVTCQICMSFPIIDTTEERKKYIFIFGTYGWRKWRLSILNMM